MMYFLNSFKQICPDMLTAILTLKLSKNNQFKYNQDCLISLDFNFSTKLAAGLLQAASNA